MPCQVLIGAVRPEEREPLVAALSSRGIAAEVVTTGPDALLAAERSRPELVVVDLHLPGLHGIEVARALPDRRTVLLVDPDERALPDLRRLGLEVLVRREGGAAALAGAIQERLGGPRRLAKELARGGEEDDRHLRAELLERVGGDEERLLRLVLEDPVTHLFTAAYLKRRLAEEWLRSRTEGRPLGLVVGEVTGPGEPKPELEARLAGVLLTELAGTALPGREGPGRYVVLLPGTDRAGAERAAREVLRASREILAGAQARLALGLAALPDPLVESAEKLYEAAKTALAVARARGADRVYRWVGVEEVGEEP